jgi:hypothetical protein
MRFDEPAARKLWAEPQPRVAAERIQRIEGRMETDPASIGEKFNRILPKNIREASAVFVSLILLAVGMWPAVVFSLLIGALLSLMQRIFSERAPQPHYDVFYDELLLASRLPPNGKYGEVFVSDIERVNEGLFILRIDHKQRESFFSYGFRYSVCVPGGTEQEIEDVAIYATEILPASMYGRWWEGLLFRAGQYITADGEIFQWFTADPRKSLAKHPLPADYKEKPLH